MTEENIARRMDAVAGALAAAGAENPAWLLVLSGEEASVLARENAVGEVPGRDQIMPWRAPVPTTWLVITGLHAGTMSEALAWVRRYYPEHHGATLVRGTTPEPITLTTTLAGAGGNEEVTLVVPPVAEMENVRTFPGMMQLTRRLRGPGGCPWDREQTHATLKPYLLEETYEVLDALDSGDPRQIAEEFGDLLYQITIHAQVAAEEGTFSIEDVIQNIMTKLIGRHPHVFGDMELGSAQEVREAWETLKQKQKPKRASVLEEIPRGLPALPQSNLMQKRAASQGFDWADTAGALDQATEELNELRAELTGEDRERLREELGDVLFAVVSVARRLRIDPEEALRLANRKFASRFGRLEARLREQDRTLRDLSEAEMLALWAETGEEEATG